MGSPSLLPRSGPVPKWPTSWKGHRKNRVRAERYALAHATRPKGSWLWRPQPLPVYRQRYHQECSWQRSRNSQRFEIRNCRWFLARGDQGVERFFGAPMVERPGRQRSALLQALCLAGDDKGGGGIEEDNIAERPRLSP